MRQGQNLTFLICFVLESLILQGPKLVDRNKSFPQVICSELYEEIYQLGQGPWIGENAREIVLRTCSQERSRKGQESRENWGWRRILWHESSITDSRQDRKYSHFLDQEENTDGGGWERGGSRCLQSGPKVEAPTNCGPMVGNEEWWRQAINGRKEEVGIKKYVYIVFIFYFWISALESLKLTPLSSHVLIWEIK